MDIKRLFAGFVAALMFGAICASAQTFIVGGDFFRLMAIDIGALLAFLVLVFLAGYAAGLTK